MYQLVLNKSFESVGKIFNEIKRYIMPKLYLSLNELSIRFRSTSMDTVSKRSRRMDKRYPSQQYEMQANEIGERQEREIFEKC
jgi:hypothetical protein